jgi:hypothetical protein
LRREGCSHYWARRFLCRRLWRSSVDFDVPWLNSARTSICGSMLWRHVDTSSCRESIK